MVMATTTTPMTSKVPMHHKEEAEGMRSTGLGATIMLSQPVTAAGEEEVDSPGVASEEGSAVTDEAAMVEAVMDEVVDTINPAMETTTMMTMLLSQAPTCPAIQRERAREEPRVVRLDP